MELFLKHIRCDAYVSFDKRRYLQYFEHSDFPISKFRGESLCLRLGLVVYVRLACLPTSDSNCLEQENINYHLSLHTHHFGVLEIGVETT